MKISEQWLRHWANPAVDTDSLAAQLTMSGFEVEGVEAAAPPLAHVVLGRVTDLQPHPEADKLRVAQVDVGSGAPLTIVCGAPNVTAGGYYPTALVGATLPGNMEIREAQLRGVPSQGMLCSAREIGLSEDASGLMPLPEGIPGTPLVDFLGLADQVLEIALTPNRGDCLSVAGIAREVAVLNRVAYHAVDCAPVMPSHDDSFPITLASPADCPRYVGRVIRNVNPRATTPVWMQECLRRSGIRSLGPLVDVTNYVMLELGQPLHAFDLGKLQDGIVVRRATAGETLTLLNGQTVTLEPDVLLISDGSGPLALAGIMGGEHSGCSDDTQDVFLEAAFFTPTSIAGRARRYGLHTDSSHRFERGVDPDLQVRAAERFTALLIDIAGGEAGQVLDQRVDEHLPRPPVVALRSQRINQILGTTIAASEVEDTLQRLDMTVVKADDHWRVTPPSFRFDIAIEADLIEEVGRVHGYDNIPKAAPTVKLAADGRPEAQLTVARLREALIQRGYQEAITYSFVGTQAQTLLDPDLTPEPLANPISTDLAVMRTTLWAGLLGALDYNLKRQQSRVRLFENGLSFRRLLGGDLIQEPYLAAVACGAAEPEQWGSKSRGVDFYDLKGDLDALTALSGQGLDYRPERHPGLHPGQSARLYRDDSPVGWIGTLHPAVARKLDIDPSVVVFEVKLSALQQGKVPSFQGLSKFPSSRRDLALLVAEDITAAAITAAIAQFGGDGVREVSLFDVYRGKGVPEGQKSLAFSLILQDFSANLTDEAVADITARIITGLSQQFGATLRV